LTDSSKVRLIFYTSVSALAKIQALLVFSFGSCVGKKPNVPECAVGCLFTMRHNVLVYEK